MLKLSKYWNSIINISTVTWVIVFIVSFYINHKIVEILLVLISLIFVIELIIIFSQRKSLKDFFIKNWLDIILLIPIFRIFKVLRLTKALKLSKIIKIYRKSRYFKKLPESIDLASKVKERVSSK